MNVGRVHPLHRGGRRANRPLLAKPQTGGLVKRHTHPLPLRPRRHRLRPRRPQHGRDARAVGHCRPGHTQGHETGRRALRRVSSNGKRIPFRPFISFPPSKAKAGTDSCAPFRPYIYLSSFFFDKNTQFYVLFPFFYLLTFAFNNKSRRLRPQQLPFIP